MPGPCSARTSSSTGTPLVTLSRRLTGARIARRPFLQGVWKRGVLSCSYHGWSFGSGGKCVSIPSAAPDFPIPDNAHLACFNTSIKYGLVWVCPGDSPKELPAIIQEQDESFRRINNPVDMWRACAMRMTDNFLDIAHFPWVHTGTFGNNQRRSVPEIELEMLEGGYYGYEYKVVADNPPGASLSSGRSSEVVSRHMTTGFHLPFTVRSTISYDSGLHHIMLLLTTPIDDVTSYFTFVVWRNDDFSVSAEDVIAFDRMIGEEDKRMLEKIPGVLPFSPPCAGQFPVGQAVRRLASPVHPPAGRTGRKKQPVRVPARKSRHRRQRILSYNFK